MSIQSYRLLFGLVIGVAASITLLATAEFASLFFVSVKIHNATGSDLTRVEIGWSDSPAWSGSLEYGEEREVVGTASSDSAIRLHIETSNGKAHTEEFGYVTRFWGGGRYFVTVREPLEVIIVWCDAGFLVDYCTS